MKTLNKTKDFQTFSLPFSIRWRLKNSGIQLYSRIFGLLDDDRMQRHVMSKVNFQIMLKHFAIFSISKGRALCSDRFMLSFMFEFQSNFLCTVHRTLHLFSSILNMWFLFIVCIIWSKCRVPGLYVLHSNFYGK